MFEGLGLLRTRLIHNFPFWQLYSWLEICCILNFPPFFRILVKFKTKKKIGAYFPRNRGNSHCPIFGERIGIRLLWRESDGSWPLKRGLVSNPRHRSDLDGSAGLKRPFKRSDLRNCELNFNFRGKSWSIENHDCFISHGFYLLSRFSILTARKSLVAISVLYRVDQAE